MLRWRNTESLYHLLNYHHESGQDGGACDASLSPFTGTEGSSCRFLTVVREYSSRSSLQYC